MQTRNNEKNTTMADKLFYSCLDPYVAAPQAEQHRLISKLAVELSGKIIFYGSEDFFVAATQPFILPKLQRTPNLDGVIFFTLDQFCYSGEFNIKLLDQIVSRKLLVGFARENLTFKSHKCLSKFFLQLKAYAHCKSASVAVRALKITGAGLGAPASKTLS